MSEIDSKTAKVDSPDNMSASAETLLVVEEKPQEINPESEAEVPEEVQEEQEAEDSAPDEDDSESAPEDKSNRAIEKMEKRINKVTYEKHEALRRAQELEAKLQEVQAKMEQPQEPPSLEKFDYDQAAYMEAVVEYKLQEQAKVQAEQERQRLEQQKAAEAERSFMERSTEFASSHQDFNEVVGNPNLRITESMGEAIKLADNGPEVAYHLGKNPDRAFEIANLNPVQQIYAIGQLSSQLSTPVTPKQTTAPRPIEPVKAKSQTQKDPATMSYDEYVAWRTKRS